MVDEVKKSKARRTHTAHRYVRKNITRNPRKDPYFVLVCTLPGCLHYLRPELTLGKESVCNRCGGPFIMNQRSIKERLPHCNKCVRHQTKTVKKLDMANKLLAELGLDVIPDNEDDEAT